MNTIYDLARNMFATAQLNWTTRPLALLAFSGTPDFNPKDDTVSDITARAKMVFVKELQVIATKTVDPAGYLQTDNVVIPVVPIGAPITSFVMISKANDVPSSLPILFLDDVQGLPFVTNGLDMVVTPDWLQHRGWGRV